MSIKIKVFRQGCQVGADPLVAKARGTLGQVVACMNAYSKGVRLGIYTPEPESLKESAQEARAEERAAGRRPPPGGAGRPDRAGAIAKAGQIVVMTTDGVMETHNERSELFGRERFKEIISRNASQDAEEVLKAIVESVEKFRGEASQHDDITLVVLKFQDDARQ